MTSPAQLRAQPRGVAVAVVDAVLATARELLGCEVVALNRIDAEVVLTARTDGSLPGLTPGAWSHRADTPCDQVLAAGSATTSDAPHDPAFRELRAVTSLGLRTYVGVPVRDAQGVAVGTLCGYDRRSLPVTEHAVAVLLQLSGVLAAYADELRALDVVLVRRATGWVVEGVPAEETGTALATLVRDDPSAAPSDERDWLVASVRALEQALEDRVLLEQAVGVLTERHHVRPRQAYDELRREARPRGLRGLATAVVASASVRGAG